MKLLVRLPRKKRWIDEYWNVLTFNSAFRCEEMVSKVLVRIKLHGSECDMEIADPRI